MEIRQVSAAERVDVMYALQSYAFEGTGGFAERQEAYRRRVPYLETNTNLIAEVDGRTAACVSSYPMRQNVRGKLLDMAGIASVAAHPEFRRRGYVRALMDRVLRQTRDQGAVVSVLWPFRPSFYARFGYVGLPQRRWVEFDPAGITARDLPGEVRLHPLREVLGEYVGIVHDVLAARHGFAVFDEVKTAEWANLEDWVAIARDDAGRVQGALSYTIDRFGGELSGRYLMTTGPLGRALLLQFIGRHVDQVGRVRMGVGPGEVPELWDTDLSVTTTVRVAQPDKNAPMARILDVPGLDGLRIGGEAAAGGGTKPDGGATVEVVGDELIGGRYRFESEGGELRVERTNSPGATITAAGLAGLVYGVLDPIDVVTRGLGEIGADDQEALRTLFPRELPDVVASF